MAAATGPTDRSLVPSTVVVPTDGSALSELALPLAHRLAATFRASVCTVMVGNPGPVGRPDVALRGEPVEALLDHLADRERALVCMSSHGHGGIRRRLIGSVAEQLVRRAPVPVLVAGPRIARTGLGVPRTLLAGLSLGPRQDRLLRLLAAWAPVLGATIELAHVRLPTAAELYTARTTGRLPADRPELDVLAAELGERGIKATPHVLAGANPVTALERLAARLPPPVLLAVDSHHADEPVDHDIAYQLIRSARWPVLAGLGT